MWIALTTVAGAFESREAADNAPWVGETVCSRRRFEVVYCDAPGEKGDWRDTHMSALSSPYPPPAIFTAGRATCKLEWHDRLVVLVGVAWCTMCVVRCSSPRKGSLLVLWIETTPRVRYRWLEGSRWAWKRRTSQQAKPLANRLRSWWSLASPTPILEWTSPFQHSSRQTTRRLGSSHLHTPNAFANSASSVASCVAGVEIVHPPSSILLIANPTWYQHLVH
jgi:hypothetical protein